MSAINFVNYRGPSCGCSASSGRVRVRTSAPLPKASYRLEMVDNGDGYIMFATSLEIVWRVVCTQKDKIVNLFLNKFTHTHKGGNVVYTDGRGRVTAVQTLTDEELRQTREAIDKWMHQEVTG